LRGGRKLQNRVSLNRPVGQGAQHPKIGPIGQSSSGKFDRSGRPTNRDPPASLCPTWVAPSRSFVASPSRSHLTHPQRGPLSLYTKTAADGGQRRGVRRARGGGRRDGSSRRRQRAGGDSPTKISLACYLLPMRPLDSRLSANTASPPSTLDPIHQNL
jgi:hypothetical protein